MAIIAPFANRIAGDRVALIPAFFSSRSPGSWLKTLPVSSASRPIHYFTPQGQYCQHIDWLPSSRNYVRELPYTIMGRELYWHQLSRTFRFPCFHVRWLNPSPGLFEALFLGYSFAKPYFLSFTEYSRDGPTLYIPIGPIFFHPFPLHAPLRLQ